MATGTANSSTTKHGVIASAPQVYWEPGSCIICTIKPTSPVGRKSIVQLLHNTSQRQDLHYLRLLRVHRDMFDMCEHFPNCCAFLAGGGADTSEPRGAHLAHFLGGKSAECERKVSLGAYRVVKSKSGSRIGEAIYYLLLSRRPMLRRFSHHEYVSYDVLQVPTV